MATLESLPDVEFLTLHNTEITDDGLVHLVGLDNLQVLTLSNTRVTDAGLVHLKHLHKLEHLGLGGTKVTYRALDELRTALPNVTVTMSLAASIEIVGTVKVDTNSAYRPVIAVSFRRDVLPGPTDADLMHVRKLTTLEKLGFGNPGVGIRITDTGLQQLNELVRLQELNLSCTLVTDAGLEHLKELTSLKVLDLSSTEVTNEGVDKLQQELPNCKIIR